MSSFFLCVLAFVLATAGPAAGTAGPQSVPDKVRQGLALVEAGDPDGAKAWFREVLEVAPRHGTARLQLGRLALEEGEWDEAREHLEIAALSKPRRPYLAWSLLGRVQLLQRDAEAARESFDRSFRLAPRFAPALVGRARASLLLGDLEGALDDLETAATLPATAHEASLLAAQVLICLDRFGDARNRLEELALGDERIAERMLLSSITASEPKSLKVELGRHLDLSAGYLALGVFYLRKGQADRAEPLLRIVLDMDDRQAIAALLLEKATGDPSPVDVPESFPELATKMADALRYAEEGSSEEARRLAAEILARRSYYVPARLLWIRDAEERHDRWEAMRGYRQLLEWLPGLPLLLARRAQLAHAMGASVLAEESAREAIESLPEDGSLHHLLASIQADAGQSDAALESCRKAIDLGFTANLAEASRAYVTLGRLLLVKMQVSEAVAAYGKALELDPAAVEVLPSFSLAALTAEDFTALEALLTRYVESHPEDVSTLYGLGTMSLRKSDLKKAKEYFQELTRLDPDHSQACYNLGLIHLREGNEHDAQAAMERFRELKAREDEEFERHNRAHFLRLEAEEAVAGGRTAQATLILTGIVADGLGGVADFLAIGSAWLRAGDGAKAFAWYERVLEADPYDREALLGLAQAAEALHWKEVADECRERLELLGGR